MPVLGIWATGVGERGRAGGWARYFPAVAEQTGGRYFRARDTQSLQEIYARINELEKSKIIERQYEQFADMSVDAVRLGGISFPPLLIIPLLALLLELGLAHTAYRRLP